MSFVTQQQICQARQKLAGSYATAARLHAETVVNLTTRETRGAEFERLCKQEREARERTKAERLMFEEHLASHGC
jgi:hypothetical protein